MGRTLLTSLVLLAPPGLSQPASGRVGAMACVPREPLPCGLQRAIHPVGGAERRDRSRRPRREARAPGSTAWRSPGRERGAPPASVLSIPGSWPG